MSNHNILYIDTALETCQILYYQNNRCLFSYLSPPTRFGHAEVFFQKLDQLKAQDESLLDNLDKIIVNIGPGRFNALRVGVGFSLTLSSVLNIELYSVTSFDILRAQILSSPQMPNTKFDMAIFAKFKHAYYLKSNISEPVLAKFDEINMSQTYALGFTESEVLESFKELVVTERSMLLKCAKKVVDLHDLEPIYIGHQVSS